MPSTFGSMTSSTIASGGHSRTICNPAEPSAAALTSYPSSPSPISKSSRMCRSSSTTRTRVDWFIARCYEAFLRTAWGWRILTAFSGVSQRRETYFVHALDRSDCQSGKRSHCRRRRFDRRFGCDARHDVCGNAWRSGRERNDRRSPHDAPHRRIDERRARRRSKLPSREPGCAVVPWPSIRGIAACAPHFPRPPYRRSRIRAARFPNARAT